MIGTEPVYAREALKCALFLQWYEVAEPFYLTGILQLDGPSKAAVLRHAEEFLADADNRDLRDGRLVRRSC